MLEHEASRHSALLPAFIDEASLDQFDPNQIDYDAINAMIADGTAPGLDLDALSAAQEVKHSRQRSDTAQHPLPHDSQAGLSDQRNTNAYDLFDGHFYRIGAFYQYPPSPPSDDCFNMEPILHIPLEPQLGCIAQHPGHVAIDTVVPARAAAVNLIDPCMPCANDCVQHAHDTSGLDGPSGRLPSAERQSCLGLTRGAEQSSVGSDVGNARSASPASFPTRASRKRARNASGSMTGQADALVAKRSKLAPAPPRSRKILPLGSVSAHVSQNSSQPCQTASFSTKVDASDATSVPMLSTPEGFEPDHSLLFANYMQARQAASRRKIMHDWEPVQPDSSLPKSNTQRCMCVGMLVDAFKDTSRSIDVQENKSFQRGWTALAAASSLSVDQLIEAVCWQLVRIAEELHTRGPISLNVFDETKLRDIKKFQGLTFGERMTKIGELLRVSKNRCGSLLKSEGLHMAVAAPTQLAAQTHWNKRQNTVRQKSLAAGRDVHKRKAPDHEQFEGGSVQDYQPLPLISPSSDSHPLGHVNGIDSFSRSSSPPTCVLEAKPSYDSKVLFPDPTSPPQTIDPRLMAKSQQVGLCEDKADTASQPNHGVSRQLRRRRRPQTTVLDDSKHTRAAGRQKRRRRT